MSSESTDRGLAGEMPSTTSGIGETLQRVRRERGLSLRTLASRAGFSPSFLSQVENGQTSPSIASLEKLAGSLGLRLVDFFEEVQSLADTPGEASPRRHLTSEWSRASMEPLLAKGSLQRLDGMVITIATGGRSGKKPSTSTTEQLVYVLEGRLALSLDDDRQLVLEAGGAAAIPAGCSYLWRNSGPRKSRVLVVTAR